jgi:hypothetical protein
MAEAVPFHKSLRSFAPLGPFDSAQGRLLRIPLGFSLGSGKTGRLARRPSLHRDQKLAGKSARATHETHLHTCRRDAGATYEQPLVLPQLMHL